MTANNQNLGKNFLRKSTNKGKKYMNPIQAHLLQPNSRKLAIHASCFECCGGINADDNKGVITEIKNCEITNCSLWNFRKYKNEKTLVRIETPASALDSSTKTNEVNQL